MQYDPGTTQLRGERINRWAIVSFLLSLVTRFRCHEEKGTRTQEGESTWNREWNARHVQGGIRSPSELSSNRPEKANLTPARTIHDGRPRPKPGGRASLHDSRLGSQWDAARFACQRRKFRRSVCRARTWSPTAAACLVGEALHPSRPPGEESRGHLSFHTHGRSDGGAVRHQKSSVRAATAALAARRDWVRWCDSPVNPFAARAHVDDTAVYWLVAPPVPWPAVNKYMGARPLVSSNPVRGPSNT